MNMKHERIISKKFLRDLTEIKQIPGSSRNFNISEPSDFAPNGRSYYSRPEDWKEKHEWVKSQLEPASYICKGSSSWGSRWSNGNPIEEIFVDYWNDFDVIKEIIELSLPAKPRKTEGRNPREEALVKEINTFLRENGSYETVDAIADNRLECCIIEGDWKHEHWVFKQLIDKFFGQKGIGYDIQVYAEPSDQDSYTARYLIDVELRDDLTESTQSDRKRVSIAFDANVADDISEKDIEEMITKALKSVRIEADSYFEIHTIN